MAEAFHVRPARDEDRLPMAVVFAAIAEERDGIATEPPVDVELTISVWVSLRHEPSELAVFELALLHYPSGKYTVPRPCCFPCQKSPT